MKVQPTVIRPPQSEPKSVQNQSPALREQLRAKEAVIQGEPEQETAAFSLRETEAAVSKVNQTTDAFNIGLRFKLHKETERVMVQIVDVEENEVIKEIPPEKLLNLAAQIQDMIGLMLDTKR